MGTDIRFFVEYKAPESGNWIGLAEFHPFRDSQLIDRFSRLAELRSLPVNYSVRFFERAFVCIAQEWQIPDCIGERFVTEQLAKQWNVNEGLMVYKNEKADASWILSQEFRHASWLEFSEFECILHENFESENRAVEYQIMYGAMKAVEARLGAGATRAIFWTC